MCLKLNTITFIVGTLYNYLNMSTHCRIVVKIWIIMYTGVNSSCTIIEPRREKTGLRGFRPGPTQTELYSHRIWLKRNCTIGVAKTKALISFALTAKLTSVFVFAYAKAGFLTTRLI